MLYGKTLIVLLIICSTPKVQLSAKFTNLVCNSIDKDFTDFEHCYIKAINRTYQYISVKVNLLKVPLTNISVTVSLLKRANGYRPFLYNFTFDACKFLKHQKNPLFNHFYQIIADYSNMNHSCPYNHDIIVDRLSTQNIDKLFTDKLPVPRGDYAVFSFWSAYNVPRAYIKAYATMG